MSKQYDVIVVGAGIAGLTAAIYVRRANKRVLVLEGKAYGGQIINTTRIENYPAMMGVSGVELAQNLYSQATELGAEVEFEEVTGIRDLGEQKEVQTEDTIYLAKAVVLAVGSEDRKMEIPREELLTGRGVSYCATCDGALYKGKKVAVIGGGNTALYDTLYLADIVEKVYLVHRRNEFRGDAVLVEKIKQKKNVEFVLERKPTEILGEKKVEGLKLNDDRILEVSGIFVAVGKKPATEPYRGLVDVDESGYIKAGEDCHTSCVGVFVAGDCRTKSVRQLVTAASDGAVAAEEAVRSLN